MVNAGISVKNIRGYIGERAGGFEKLGLTTKDDYNYVNIERLKLIEAADAQSLVNHLWSRQAQDAVLLLHWSMSFGGTMSPNWIMVAL